MSNYCTIVQRNKLSAQVVLAFSTLYWDYLSRHESTLQKNQRMSLQVRNLHQGG